MKVRNFSECLRRARKDAGYATKKALFDKIGMGVMTYTYMENGNRPNPAWNHVYTLIVHGNLPLEAFFPPRTIREAHARLPKPRPKKQKKPTITRISVLLSERATDAPQFSNNGDVP